MRKFPPRSVSHFLHNGTTTFPPPPQLSPQIAPSPAAAAEATTTTTSRLLYSSPSPSIVDGGLDFASLSLISCLLILSFLSLFFIIHLRYKSRLLPHLQNFNSLWTVRLLLVFFATFWALNEVLRLPFLHRTYNSFPFLTPLTLAQQSSMCKVHVVLSLGFFEPGFLVTLLFLVNVSVKKSNPSRMWAVAAVAVACSPILLLQTILVFFSPLETQSEKFFMHPSSIISMDSHGNEFVICTYPTFSCVVFGAFAVAYSLAFLLSCWKVVAFVINKTISCRINTLAITVMVALPAQIICLCLLLVSLPGGHIHGCAIFAMFLSFSWCVAVGEIILIIKPIADSLAAAAGSGEYRGYSPDVRAETRRWEGGGGG